jgi:hypothetical protein
MANNKIYNLLLKQGDSNLVYITIAEIPDVQSIRVCVTKSEKDKTVIFVPTVELLDNNELALINFGAIQGYTHLPSDIPQSMLKLDKKGFNRFMTLEYPDIPGKPYVWEFEVTTTQNVKTTYLTGGLVLIRDYAYT